MIYMCLAVPVQVTALDNAVATCRLGESETTIQASLLLLDEEVAEGDYLLVHAGFALRKLDPEEAGKTLDLLRQMAAQEDFGS